MRIQRDAFLSVAALTAACLLLAACANSGRDARNSAIANGLAGEQVDSVCFNRQINSWHPFDRDSIILSHGVNDYYLVKVIGACRIEDAFLSIQLNSRGGSCLTPGDEISFRNDQGITCSVGDIHRWHLADTAGQ